MKTKLLNRILCLSALVLLSIGGKAQTTLIHYWNFNHFSGTYHNPNIPALKADYSIIDTNKTALAYKLVAVNSAYLGYVDAVTTGTADSDVYNLRTIAGVATPAGVGYRFRNPSDSAYLMLYMPSTGYKNLKVTYAVEASSTATGIHTNNFSYSTDSGATWKTVGLDHLSDSTVSIGAYTASQPVYKLITVTFTSADTLVNNNPKLVFRIIPSATPPLGIVTGTTGNDRFDNFALDGDPYTSTPVYTTSNIIPIHYWHFNNLTSAFTGGVNPALLPAIKADFSMIDTNAAKVVYQLQPGVVSAYSTYYDVNGGDTINARLGQVATGSALRLRNPSDSMELRIYAPTTAHKNIKLTFETEASGTTNGAKNQLFDYSLDSGATWVSTGMIINGVAGTKDSVTAAWAKVQVAFDSTVNNNPRFVARMKFQVTTTGTSGNDRIDNITIDGDTLVPVVIPPYTTSAVVPVHYWHFNNLTSAFTGGVNPALLPAIKANFSMIDTNAAKIVYQLQPGVVSAYTTYYDVNGGDTINARLGQVATGNSLRLRNPSDSMELRIYAPTTAHKNIKLTFETEASGTTNGAKNQLFDYSLDSGATWVSTGMKVNSVAGTKDSVTAAWAKVQVAFDTTVNNNPRFVARMKFQVTTTGTSGNDRIDNVTIDGDTLIAVTPPPPPPVTALIHYWNFNKLAAVYKNPNIPALKADWSAIDTNKTSLVYQLATNASATYAGYVDTLISSPADSDIYNLRTIAGVPTPAGNAYRFRNPSDSASLVFYMPSTNYKDLVFSYAVEASSVTSGIHTNNFSYSTDSGATWKTVGLDHLSDSTISVTGYTGPQCVFKPIVVKFTAADAAVNNNPRLAFKITPSGNTSLTKGNDRFDNFTLDGVVIDTSIHVSVPVVFTSTTPVLYPNPAGNNVYINTFSEGEKVVVVYNIAGQKVYSNSFADRIVNINTANLIAGMYYVTMRSANGDVHTMKFVKQ